MKHKPDSPARRKLIGLILIDLSVRVVMPAGYMPAPMGEGGPFVLCPGASAGASVFLGAQDDAHARHGHGDEEGVRIDANTWEFCPFGAVFGAALLVSDAHLALPSIQHLVPPAGPPLSFANTKVRSFRARAPPSIEPLTTR